MLVLAVALGACGRDEPASHQGYIEAEFVQVAAPLGGQLERLAVEKGARVEQGAALFALERGSEQAALVQAQKQQQAAEARLADLRKGSRPTELAALEAQLERAQSARELSQLELERQRQLFERRVAAESDFDRARLTHEQNLRAEQQLQAQLETARLGARSDAITAAEAEVAAARAAVERAQWSVAQKERAAPRAGLVFDTLYREGEFVAAGMPVVTLLPPEGVKVRFFVPEAEFAGLSAGGSVQVHLDGRDAPLDARISYLSPQPEYTPPVLYNRENRAKLVFMVEAVFAPADARDLHPGQPVDVRPVR